MRFPEFSGEWLTYSLGEIADVTKLAGYEFTKYVTYEDEGSVIALRGLNCKNGTLILDDVKYIDHSDLSKLTRSKLYIGDILYTYVGTVGEVAIITENDKYYLAPNVSRIRVEQGFDSQLIKHLLSSNRFYKQIVLPLIATSSQPALSMENIRKFQINVPNTIKEQKHIATILTLLEERINTQSKIIEELTALRSALLEKCSRQAGTLFSLADILEETDERSTVVNQHQVLSSTVKGIFSQKEYFNKDIASEDNKGYKVVRRGNVVLSPQNLWMGNINYNNRFDVGIVSPSYKIYSIKKGFNPTFIAALLKTKKALYEYMLASEQGASIVRRNLNIESFMAIKFRIPDARQQDSLSMAIAAINAKLNNERCYLEQLTMQKSCLLENMFI